MAAQSSQKTFHKQVQKEKLDHYVQLTVARFSKLSENVKANKIWVKLAEKYIEVAGGMNKISRQMLEEHIEQRNPECYEDAISLLIEYTGQEDVEFLSDRSLIAPSNLEASRAVPLLTSKKLERLIERVEQELDSDLFNVAKHLRYVKEYLTAAPAPQDRFDNTRAKLYWCLEKYGLSMYNCPDWWFAVSKAFQLHMTHMLKAEPKYRFYGRSVRYSPNALAAPGSSLVYPTCFDLCEAFLRVCDRACSFHAADYCDTGRLKDFYECIRAVIRCEREVHIFSDENDWNMMLYEYIGRFFLRCANYFYELDDENDVKFFSFCAQHFGLPLEKKEDFRQIPLQRLYYRSLAGQRLSESSYALLLLNFKDTKGYFSWQEEVISVVNRFFGGNCERDLLFNEFVYPLRDHVAFEEDVSKYDILSVGATACSEVLQPHHLMKWLVGDLTRISWLRSVWAKRAVCEQRISQNCPAPVGLSSFQPLLQAAFAKLGGRRVPPASFDHLQSVVGSLSLLDIDFFVGLCLPVGKPVVPLQIYERNRKSGFLDSPFVFWTSLVHMYQVSEGCFRYKEGESLIGDPSDILADIIELWNHSKAFKDVPRLKEYHMFGVEPASEKFERSQHHGGSSLMQNDYFSPMSAAQRPYSGSRPPMERGHSNGSLPHTNERAASIPSPPSETPFTMTSSLASSVSPSTTPLGSEAFSASRSHGPPVFSFAFTDLSSANSVQNAQQVQLEPNPPPFSAAAQERSNAGSETEPAMQFKPILDVQKVAEHTGEEDEDCLMQLHAKLYRFDLPSKAFKERGVGVLKMLQHRQTGRVRLLMRRDNLFKICANHYLTLEMELKPMASAKNAWIWSTPADFSNEEPSSELFAIRFKCCEDSKTFKTLFEKYTQEEKQRDRGPSQSSQMNISLALPQGATPAENKQLERSQKPFDFREKYTQEEKQTDRVPLQSSQMDISLALPQEATPAENKQLERSQKPFDFRAVWTASGEQAMSTTDQSSLPKFTGFSFSGSSAQLDVHLQKNLETPSKSSTLTFSKNEPFNFSAPSNLIRSSFSGITAESRNEAGKKSAENESQGTTDDSPQPFFEPILEVKPVKTLTGEENEEVLLELHGKLYRYDTTNKSFKERGTGIMKVLKDSLTKKVRLLMRRDKLLKVCANHYLTKDMTIEPLKSTKNTWLWSTAADFSDDTPTPELLALRLKTAEDSHKFKEVFESCTREDHCKDDREKIAGATFPEETEVAPRPNSIAFNNGAGKKLTSSTVASSKDDELIIVKEVTPTEEQIKLASSLFFPKNFYTIIERTSSENSPSQSHARPLLLGDTQSLLGPASESQEVPHGLKSAETGSEAPETSHSGRSSEDENYVSSEDDAYSYDEPDEDTDAYTDVSYDERETEEDDNDSDVYDGEDDGEGGDGLSSSAFNKEEGKVLVSEHSTACMPSMILPENSKYSLSTEASDPKTPLGYVKTTNVDDSAFTVSITPSEISSASPTALAEDKGSTVNLFSSFLQPGKTFSSGFGKSLEVKPLSSIFGPSQIAHETNEEKEEAAKDVSFEPILNVKKTEAPTGEENEDTLLSVRAKLYRFDKEVNTFKERGIGDLKFLQNKESGRVRIVMRRDKILKVCANHYLTSDMKLEPLKTSKWSWLWATAADYSDNEPLGEVFAVRLRGEEDSNKFVKLFEKYTKLSQ
jgi:hypothetical protein